MWNPLRRPVPPANKAPDPEIRPCGLCLQCVRACPTGALSYQDKVWSLDLEYCRFCRACARVCPNGLISDYAI